MTRTINLELSTYMTSVNDLMKAAAGVSYTDVVKDIHGSYAAIRVAFDTSVPAQNFVSRIIEDQGFHSVADAGDAAREINLRLAALTLFAKGAADWAPLRGSGAFHTTDGDEIFVVVPAKVDGNGWGFEAKRLTAGELSYDGAFATVTGQPEYDLIGGGIDIQDAVAALENRPAATMGL